MQINLTFDEIWMKIYDENVNFRKTSHWTWNGQCIDRQQIVLYVSLATIDNIPFSLTGHWKGWIVYAECH